VDHPPEREIDSVRRGLTCVLTYENILTMTRLRAIRERKGVSLRGLKKTSGVAVATLARIEAGGYDPRLSTLRRLAKALEVTVAELIGEKSLKKGG
jgi:transcriptional regulator with XRE-family HTH domain